jgi:hypothetical protein
MLFQDEVEQGNGFIYDTPTESSRFDRHDIGSVSDLCANQAGNRRKHHDGSDNFALRHASDCRRGLNISTGTLFLALKRVGQTGCVRRALNPQ